MTSDGKTLCKPCTCNELSTDLEGLKLDIAIAEAKQNEGNKHNNQAIDLVRLDVISIQRDFERIDRIVNNLTIAKITSDSCNAEKTLRLMNENKVLSSKGETLKSELQKRENAGVKTKAAVESLANITKESNKENLNMETNQPAKQKCQGKKSLHAKIFPHMNTDLKCDGAIVAAFFKAKFFKQ